MHGCRFLCNVNVYKAIELLSITLSYHHSLLQYFNQSLISVILFGSACKCDQWEICFTSRAVCVENNKSNFLSFIGTEDYFTSVE